MNSLKFNKKKEEEAIKLVLKYAKKYGYNHFIAILKREWALKLMKDLGMKKEVAIESADVPAYPIKKEENV